MHLRVDLGGRRIIKKIFFKQKTAYEIVARDWSSDVCSSDLLRHVRVLILINEDILKQVLIIKEERGIYF